MDKKLNTKVVNKSKYGLPTYETENAAGADLRANTMISALLNGLLLLDEICLVSVSSSVSCNIKNFYD